MLHVQSLDYVPAHGRGRTLSQLNFQLGPSERLGVLGPRGAGKATLQNILLGVYRNYSGTVHFQGKELKDWSRDFYEVIGTVLAPPASIQGTKLTAREYLQYYGSLYRGPLESISELLASVGLQHAANRPIRKYTPGMFARLGMARALLHKPIMLILYEPLAALEPENQEIIHNLIRSQKLRGCGVLFFTENEGLANNLSDHIVRIENGKTTDTLEAPHGGLL